MAIVGIIALVIVALFVLAALGLTLRSLPDVARYRRLRRM
ncbi:MAG: DUF6893 family small protein [Acidimicrobiales bacterium]